MRMEEKEQRTESQWQRTPPFKPLYMDGDLAVFDVNEVLIRERHGELRLDFFMLIFCWQGELRVSMNTHELQLNKHEILVCRPNDQLYETVVTDDFQGTLICLSQRAIQDTIRLDSQVWHRAFVLGECPVLRITAQENELFNRYSQLMAFRTQLKGRLYSKEDCRLPRFPQHLLLRQICAQPRRLLPQGIPPPLAGGAVKEGETAKWFRMSTSSPMSGSI